MKGYIHTYIFIYRHTCTNDAICIDTNKQYVKCMYVCMYLYVQVFAEIGSASVLTFAEQLLPVVRIGLGVSAVVKKNLGNP